MGDTNSDMHPLTRGHKRIQAIRDLADGMSIAEFAKKWNVHTQTVVVFKRTNRADILALRASVADEVRHLWIADKTNRIYEYQQAAEDLDRAVAFMIDSNGILTKDDIALLAEKRKTFKAVAEELGQLPNRNSVEIQGANVTYNYVGVDPDDLT